MALKVHSQHSELSLLLRPVLSTNNSSLFFLPPSLPPLFSCCCSLHISCHLSALSPSLSSPPSTRGLPAVLFAWLLLAFRPRIFREVQFCHFSTRGWVFSALMGEICQTSGVGLWDWGPGSEHACPLLSMEGLSPFFFLLVSPLSGFQTQCLLLTTCKSTNN